MVEFKALYFASARDAAQDKAFEILQIADKQPATMASALECIKVTYPEMKSVLEYCDKDDMARIEIKDMDTVAIIPPVSGG
ncbi:hypothetical protein GGI17_001186 [Coemansia sp. S146]|nr:hypothetical protein GGI17_001186 [Coemansia sp. S146]